MTRVVFDASAVIIFLANQPGAAEIELLLDAAVKGTAELFLSVINWGEIYYSIWQKNGPAAAAQALAEIARMPIEIVPVDLTITRQAAEYKARDKLPYADAFVAALATLRDAEVVTKDADFRRVSHLISVQFL